MNILQGGFGTPARTTTPLISHFAHTEAGVRASYAVGQSVRWGCLSLFLTNTSGYGEHTTTPPSRPRATSSLPRFSLPFFPTKNMGCMLCVTRCAFCAPVAFQLRRLCPSLSLSLSLSLYLYLSPYPSTFPILSLPALAPSGEPSGNPTDSELSTAPPPPHSPLRCHEIRHRVKRSPANVVRQDQDETKESWGREGWTEIYEQQESAFGWLG